MAERSRLVGGEALECLCESAPDEEDVTGSEGDFFFFGDFFDDV